MPEGFPNEITGTVALDLPSGSRRQMPIISNLLKIRIRGLRAISHLQVQFNWSRVVIPVQWISLMPTSSHSGVGWIPGWPTCRPADEQIASADD